MVLLFCWFYSLGGGGVLLLLLLLSCSGGGLSFWSSVFGLWEADFVAPVQAVQLP
jgi:hypothetical protein